jgi:glyoxylase-like metal-dependent hydrolase (beta-lactamase superfamily II)
MSTRQSTLSRRDALRLLGAGSAGALFNPSTVSAAPPAVANAAPPDRAIQGAGFYRMAIGNIEVAVVSDGELAFDAAYPLFGANATKQQVEAALHEAFIAPRPVRIQVNTLLVRAAGELILIDTGAGSLLGPTTGLLIENLRRAGAAPEQVTQVVLTHLHPDHLGGALDAMGRRAFPRAELLMHRAERDFWTAAEPDFSRSTAPKEIRQLAVSTARRLLGVFEDNLTLLEGDKPLIAPGVTAHLARGHSPGHLIVAIESGDQRMMYLADLVHHHAIILPHPGWHVALDTDRELGAKARTELFGRLAADRTLVGGAHLPFPALGHLRRSGDGYQWAPIEWAWEPHGAAR